VAAKAHSATLTGIPRLHARKLLKGHFGKVYALAWAKDSSTLVTASQDGNLIFWDGEHGSKTHAIALQSSWVMTCAFEQSASELVAAGGLDNKCTVYRAAAPGSVEVELKHHEGYLSCCKFADSKTMLTSSGDSTCVLWDVGAGRPTTVFDDHAGDVMTLDVHPTNPSLFVSGSCDCTAKLWDARSGACTMTFAGKEGDINATAFMGNGMAFATGAEEGVGRLFDLRSFGMVNEFSNDVMLTGIAGLAFSKSGRVLFTGCDDNVIYAWDALEDRSSPLQSLEYHQGRVAGVALPPSGQCLAAASWDFDVSIWA